MDGENKKPNTGGAADQGQNNMGGQFADESNISAGPKGGGDSGGPEKAQSFKDKAKNTAINSSDTAQKIKKNVDDAKKVIDPKVSSNQMAKEELQNAEGVGGKVDAAARIAAAKGASTAADVASGGATKAVPGLDKAIEKGTMVVTRPENRKKAIITALAILLVPFILVGLIIGIIIYAASDPAKFISQVVTNPKVREFAVQAAGLAAKGVLSNEETLKKYGYVEYKEGTAIAAVPTNNPKPGSLADKVSRIDLKTASYQTEMPPDCPYRFTYKTMTNGKNTVNTIDKVYDKKGQEASSRGFLYGYCLANSMPLYNMMVRTQKARDTNSFSGTTLNYADTKDGFKQECKSIEEQNDCAYNKTRKRVTSKEAERPTYKKEYKDLSSEDKPIVKYIDQVISAINNPEDPNYKNPNNVNFIVKNSGSTDTIARTMCLFSENYLSADNIKKTIGSRLNTGQRSGMKWNTLSSTRQVGDVSNEELTANVKTTSGWTASTAYSQNVYGTLSGTDIDPEAVGNASYGANYEDVLSLLIKLNQSCGDVDNANSFFGNILSFFSVGKTESEAQQEVINIYESLQELIIIGSNGKFKSKNDFGLQQLIISVIRIGGGSAVSGLEDGTQNFNNQSQGYRSIANQYMSQMGGRFLNKEEARKLNILSENTRIEVEKKNGIAYRLYGKDNIRSVASIMQHETPRTADEVKTKTKQFIASISNPIKLIADAQNTIGYVTTGTRNIAFAAGETGDAYMKLNTVGIPESDLENVDVYAVSDEIQRIQESGTAQQKEVIAYFDKCSKANIPTANFFARGYDVSAKGEILKSKPSKKDKVDGVSLPIYPALGEFEGNTKQSFEVLGFSSRKELIACELYMLPNNEATKADYNDSTQKALFGFNINELAKKYHIYLYANSTADLMLQLSDTEKTESIYANKAAAETETGGGAINTTIVAGDTSNLTCSAGTDAGIGDGYKDGKLYKIRLCNVQGITVNAQIASNIDSLLNVSRASGIILKGGGFRTMESQIKLRGTNGCPDTYVAKSSSCRVPTARPGYSNHQMGLAIDFTYNGSIISSRSNAGWIWLNQNAGKFGLINLKSEPWHWSVDGN